MSKTEAYLKSDAEEGIRLASAILEAVRGLFNKHGKL